MSDLDAQLIAAHEAEDNDALITLDSLAAARAADTDCFYLTHAYIFALELGDARATALRAQLVAHGRETPD